MRDVQQVIHNLLGWRCVAIVYQPLARVAPGIAAALSEQGIDSVEVDQESEFEKQLPNDTAILALGAVFEPFALDLFASAKLRHIPVIAIEEVAQLALNQFDINNYDAPFDRLFVASPDEHRRFVDLGYPSEILSVSGLLANDRFGAGETLCGDKMLIKLGISDGKKPIVYTTSPIRGRLSLHNKDDLHFREAVLTQIAIASRKTGRKAVIKLHPNEDIETAQERIRKVIPDGIVFGREINMDKLFAVTGVLVNRGNSQTCLEAVLRGIPTVVAACGLKTLFHDDGGAHVVDELSKVSEAIERADNEGPIDASRIKAKHFFLPPEGVAGFIAKEIFNLVSNPQPATEYTWNWLIKSMLFVGRHDRAFALCKTLRPRSPWQKLVHDALQSHSGGHIEDSIACWLRCAQFDPHWYFPQYELAHGFQATKEFDKAIERAHKAIKLHPPFHSLWHEIPMRVVIMASNRQMGDISRAASELKLMEDRGLVDIVPELLIEKAAQLSSNSEWLAEAEHRLDNAINLLNNFPINKNTDSHLLERAVFQYLGVAKRYVATGDRSRSLACLERTAKMGSRIRAITEPIVSQSLELGQQSENDKDLHTAEKCYNLAAETDPTDYTSQYGLARVALKQGKLYNAIGALCLLIEIPDGPKQVVATILSPAAAARLLDNWPATPKSILRPMKLSAYAFAWAVQRMVKSDFHDFFEATTALLMIWMFVSRHFYRRLSANFAGIQRACRALRSRLFRKSSSSTYHVTNCPICGSAGKFEYQNKLTPLFRCRKCDHVYARELPDDKALSTLYGDLSYWEKDRCHQGITTIQESKGWETYLNARIGILERLRLLECPSTRTQSVFEIGCAEGMLLHALGKKGIAAIGCEMNRAVAREGMGQLGVNILTDPFENLELPQSHFDLVMSFHTLEHLRFPAEIFAKAANILRSDGAILIEVPCGEEEYDNTDHLHFFSDKSLRLLLNQFFYTTEIIDNAYTNSAGVRIGSIYGFGRGVRCKQTE
ncbi:MAG TPA: methyltransferase domain-containing protein [Candidatus Binatia bacterium]|nr:methyltransferase domain-containing protein [Candidatus Binatia bacterium]